MATKPPTSYNQPTRGGKVTAKNQHLEAFLGAGPRGGRRVQPRSWNGKLWDLWGLLYLIPYKSLIPYIVLGFSCIRGFSYCRNYGIFLGGFNFGLEWEYLMKDIRVQQIDMSTVDVVFFVGQLFSWHTTLLTLCMEHMGQEYGNAGPMRLWVCNLSYGDILTWDMLER